MTLLAPAALWLLAAIPVVLFLHIRRRRIVDVGSTYLWRRIDLEDLVPPRRRPKASNLALWLQVIAVILVAVALARPSLTTPTGDQHRILVVDTTMLAVADVGEDRLASYAAALEAWSRPHRTGTVTVLTAEPVPRAIVVRSADASRVEAALDLLDIVDGVPDWVAVERLVDAVTVPDERTLIDVVVALESVPDAERWIGEGDGFEVRITAIGRTPVSIGLVNAVATAYDGGVVFDVDAVVDGIGAQAEVWFTATGGVPVLVDRAPVEPLPNGHGRVSIASETLGAGVATVRLVSDADQPPLIDELHVVLRGMRLARVLHVGPTNHDLIAAIAATGLARVDRAAGLPDAVDSYDLVVVDRAVVERHPGVPTLWLGVAPPIGSAGDDWIDEGGLDRGGWNDSHTLVAGVDLGAITVFRARQLPLLDGATVLLDGAGYPLLQTRDTLYGRETVVSFSTLDSDWPQLASFPIFVENLLRSVVPGVGEPQRATCVVGRVCRIGTPVAGRGLEIVDPSGATVAPVPAVIGTDRAATAFAVHSSFEGAFVPRRAGVFVVDDGHTVMSTAVRPAVSLDAALRILETSVDGVITGDVREAPTEPAVARWLLALATVVVVVEALVDRGLRRNDRGIATARRGRVVAVVSRALVVMALILAWADAPVPSIERRATVVLVVDAPDRYVGRARELLEGAFHRGALPDWDADAVLAVVRSDGHVVVPGSSPPMSAHAVDLERALRVAAGLVAEGGRIVIVGDGAESAGNLAMTVPELAARGISVDALVVGGLPLDEVWIEQVGVPARVYSGSAFDLVAVVGSESPIEARVSVWRDGEAIDEHAVLLNAGMNRLSVPLIEEEPGRHRYEVEVSGVRDQLVANRRDGVVVDVVEPLRVAVVTPDAEIGSRLVRALAAQGIDGVALAPAEAPSAPVAVSDPLAWWEDQEGWTDFVGVILAGVPAIDLSWEQQVSLASYVGDYGGGLLVVGGERTFGPGGYYLTALEEILPVEVEIPHERPTVALAFVLDRSGSMQAMVGDTGLNRLDVTKVATVGAIDMVAEDSIVGIVVFDGFATEVLALHPADDIESVIAALDPIQPGGGTNIFAGLAMGVDMLRTLDDRWTRHIILMTDGLGQGGVDYEPILEQILEAGITVSTAAIGQGADVWLLEEIAERGGGVAYATEDFRAFPSIMAQEVLLLAADPIRREAFVPVWGSRDAAFLRGLEAPHLEGFVTTSPRSGAEVHWVGPDDEPILASWRYGLGRVVALTSDGAGPWSDAWRQDPAYPAFWSQALRWASVEVPGPGLDVWARARGDEVLVEAVMLGDESQDVVRAETVARLVAVDSTQVEGLLVDERRLDEVGQGRAVAVLRAPGPGTYEVQVRTSHERLVTARSTEPIVDPVIVPVYVGYEGRFRPRAWSSEVLVGLTSATGGGFLAAGVAAPPVVSRWTMVPAPLLWGVLAVIAFVADLARRYGVLAFVRRRAGPTAARGSGVRPSAVRG